MMINHMIIKFRKVISYILSDVSAFHLRGKKKKKVLTFSAFGKEKIFTFMARLVRFNG